MRKDEAVSSDCNASAAVSPKSRMLFVLVIVFIFCSGNALGILLGAIIWVRTARKALAIGVLIGLSILGFLMALLVALVYFRGVTERAKSERSQQKPQDEIRE